MSIPENLGQDKLREGREGLGGLLRGIGQDRVLVAILALTALLFFGMGLIAARENRGPGDSLWIEQLPAVERAGGAPTTTIQKVAPEGGGPAAVAAILPPKSGTFVASKSGSKYYLPSCAGAKRIKEENKVWFATKEEAVKAGYEPATGCKGL